MTKSPIILIRRVPLDWMVRSATLQKGIEVTYGLDRCWGCRASVGLSGCRVLAAVDGPDSGRTWCHGHCRDLP